MFQPLSIFNRKRQPLAPLAASADPFFRLQHEMNRLFDETFPGFGLPAEFAGTAFSGETRPRIDMRETDKTLVVEAELPGVAESDIDVQVSDNVLTIRGEKRFEKKEDKGEEYHYLERAYGSFARSIPLPFDVDPDSVEAVFRDGVLNLTMQKPAGAATRSRKIPIKHA